MHMFTVVGENGRHTQYNTTKYNTNGISACAFFQACRAVHSKAITSSHLLLQRRQEESTWVADSHGSLVPRLFYLTQEKEPGYLCMRMCKIIMIVLWVRHKMCRDLMYMYNPVIVLQWWLQMEQQLSFPLFAGLELRRPMATQTITRLSAHLCFLSSRNHRYITLQHNCIKDSMSGWQPDEHTSTFINVADY